MTKSVCLATYNGSQFIETQLRSILSEIDAHDEVILVDDASTDQTVEIIKKMHDSRIKIYQNKSNHGHVKSFEMAIGEAQNELIFLADQDDIWPSGRVKIFVENFEKNPEIALITGNCKCIDENGKPVENPLRTVHASQSEKYNKNISDIITGSIGYYGCLMAFRKKMKPIILPIPDFIEAHDLWLAMAGNLQKSNQHLDDVVLLHRLHNRNASDIQRSFLKKLKARFQYLKGLAILKQRINS